VFITTIHLSNIAVVKRLFGVSGKYFRKKYLRKPTLDKDLRSFSKKIKKNREKFPETGSSFATFRV